MYYLTAFSVVQLKKNMKMNAVKLHWYINIKSGIKKEDATTLTKTLNRYKNTADYSIIYIFNMDTGNITMNLKYWIESLYTSQQFLIMLF